MVYTTALVFGPGMPVLSEEESVVEMIGKYLFQLTSSEKRSCARRGSVDSCDELEKTPTSADVDIGLGYEERLLQQDMTRQIERCLSEAKASTLRCQVLLLPSRMSARVARDVVRSSADEPCGLRGASIAVYLETKDELKSLGSISTDSSVTPTFELSLVFKADDDGWSPLKHIFVTERETVLKLRPEYRLVKKKLYSSASPVIHDFY
ncbi:DNA damage-inducible transcript 4-like protein [Polymixia lowei]